MKTVIRRGVFETNSSSTHSLTLNKLPDGTIPEDELKSLGNEVEFLLKSQAAKVVILRGLMLAGQYRGNKLVQKFWKAVTTEFRKQNDLNGKPLKYYVLDQMVKQGYSYNYAIENGCTEEEALRRAYRRTSIAYCYDDYSNEPWCLCSYFFPDEPLGDCTCSFCSEPNGLVEKFQLDKCKNFAALARWYLSDEVYLLGRDQDCYYGDYYEI